MSKSKCCQSIFSINVEDKKTTLKLSEWHFQNVVIEKLVKTENGDLCLEHVQTQINKYIWPGMHCITQCDQIVRIASTTTGQVWVLLHIGTHCTTQCTATVGGYK